MTYAELASWLALALVASVALAYAAGVYCGRHTAHKMRVVPMVELSIYSFKGSFE